MLVLMAIVRLDCEPVFQNAQHNSPTGNLIQIFSNSSCSKRRVAILGTANSGTQTNELKSAIYVKRSSHKCSIQHFC